MLSYTGTAGEYVKSLGTHFLLILYFEDMDWRHVIKLPPASIMVFDLPSTIWRTEFVFHWQTVTECKERDNRNRNY